MKLEDIYELANKYNSIPTHVVENSAHDITNNPYSFKGTFKEFYKNMESGKITLLVKNGQIIGGSYDTQTNDLIQDSLAQEAFEKAYSNNRAYYFMMLASKLLTARLRVEIKEIEGEEFVYLVEQGVVYTPFGGFVVARADISSASSYEEIMEILDKALLDQWLKHEDDNVYEEDEEDDEEEDEDEIEDPSAPSTVIIECENGTLTDKEIKKYLRENYGRYLSGTAEIPFTVTQEYNKIKVSNIQWGRKI